MKTAVVILTLLCIGLALALAYAIYLARCNANELLFERRASATHFRNVKVYQQRLAEAQSEICSLQLQIRNKQHIIDGIAAAQRRDAE